MAPPRIKGLPQRPSMKVIGNALGAKPLQPLEGAHMGWNSDVDGNSKTESFQVSFVILEILNGKVIRLLRTILK